MDTHSAPVETVRLRALRWDVLAVPVLAAAVYVVFLAIEFRTFVEGVFDNSDVASAPVIGQLYPHAPGGTTVILGNFPWYTTLWLELLTRHLPLHHQLWEVAPWVGSLAAIALLAWTTAVVAGRFAGALVALALAPAGSHLLPLLFAWSLHGATIAHVCVLDAFLVVLARRGGVVRSPAAHVTLCALIAAVTAAGAASDKLLYPAGVVPFAIAGAVVALRLPRRAQMRLFASVGGVTVGAIVGARIVLGAMHDRHVYGADYPIAFSAWSRLTTGVTQLVQSVLDLFGGDFAGHPVDGRSLLSLACAVVVVAAAVMGLSGARQVLASRAEATVELGLAAHVVFWLAAAALPALAFALSDAAGYRQGRYLLSTAYGIVVLAAVALARRGRTARAVGALGVTVLVVAAIVGLAERDVEADAARVEFASFLETFANGEGLQYGYAGYWDAAALTWRLGGRIAVYPVRDCDSEHKLCVFPFHRIDSWYTPRPGTRSFLVTDRRLGPNPPGLRLGGTAEVVQHGWYTIYVYDYDIASALGSSSRNYHRSV